MPEPLAIFYVCIDDCELDEDEWIYIRVCIWDTVDEMYTYMPEEEQDYVARMSCCQVVIEDDNIYMDEPEIGVMHLVRGKFGVGTVAHEIMHYIVFWKDMHHIDDEETICQHVGMVTNHFWNAFYALPNYRELME